MYAHKLYSAWVLWPLWTLHAIILILGLAVLCYLVLDWDARYDAMPTGYTVALSLAFVNFIAEPLEMVLWTYHLLEPWLYLVFQLLKAILWSVVAGFGFWILLAPRLVTGSDVVNGLLYALLAVTLVSFYASLAYAIFIFYKNHRTTGYESPYEIHEKEQIAFHNPVAKLDDHTMSGALARPASSVYEV